jgi:hypothetical protein
MNEKCKQKSPKKNGIKLMPKIMKKLEEKPLKTRHCLKFEILKNI